MYKAQYILLFTAAYALLGACSFVCSQNTAAATDMTELLEIQIVADLLDDDHFNFSVRPHADLIDYV